MTEIEKAKATLETVYREHQDAMANPGMVLIPIAHALIAIAEELETSREARIERE